MCVQTKLQAFDAYDQNGQPGAATTCLKYMILSKVLNEASHEVPALMSSKLAAKYAGKDLEAMGSIAAAAKVKSLEAFKKAVGSSSVMISCPRLINVSNSLPRLKKTARCCNQML